MNIKIFNVTLTAVTFIFVSTTFANSVISDEDLAKITWVVEPPAYDIL